MYSLKLIHRFIQSTLSPHMIQKHKKTLTAAHRSVENQWMVKQGEKQEKKPRILQSVHTMYTKERCCLFKDKGHGFFSFHGINLNKFVVMKLQTLHSCLLFISRGIRTVSIFIQTYLRGFSSVLCSFFFLWAPLHLLSYRFSWTFLKNKLHKK